MVLQQNTPLNIWGWTDSQNISVTFNGSTYTAKTSNGKWQVNLAEMQAGGPFTMEIFSKSDTVVIKDILIGEVWLCSGQSNMELTMQRVSPVYQEVINQANYPMIRQFEVPDRYNFHEPQEQLENGRWISCNPNTVMSFSAVAFFFAKDLHERYQVPIGLINASMGGSPAQAWISKEALKSFPHYLEEANLYENDTFVDSIRHSDQERSENWYSEINRLDKGIHSSKKWSAPDLNDGKWQTIKVPAIWKGLEPGLNNGVVWLRRTFNAPKSMVNKRVYLELGRIVDADSVFINGQFVGRTTYQYPPRRYYIEKGILKEGLNSIAVKVISNAGVGGFVSDKPYQITTPTDTVLLSGNWKYKIGCTMPPLASQTFIRWKPTGLYNAMIAPLIPYNIKGVIWYQGESNAWNPEEYESLFQTLISSWRNDWKRDFPFLFVQLPNFMETKTEPGPSNWAMMRDAQQRALSLPNTAMAVAIDIGEWNDIHPLNKKDVGHRLALAARHTAYSEDLVFSGPVLKDFTIKKNKIILSLDPMGKSLKTSNDQVLDGFSIAGEDQKFHWAKAKIKDNHIIIESDQVKSPVAVRYAWADNPDKANLINDEGLPASPFRTDDWEE